MNLTDESKDFYKKASDFGLKMTSGYRSPEKNESVGGSKSSYHLHGRAFDFAGSKEQMQRFYEWAKKRGGYKELIYNDTDHADHVHIAW